MEIGLEQLYVIGEELLKIPPQAFLMLLDVDIEEPLISNDELSALVKNTIVAFRLSKFPSYFHHLYNLFIFESTCRFFWLVFITACNENLRNLKKKRKYN